MRPAVLFTVLLTLAVASLVLAASVGSMPLGGRGLWAAFDGSDALARTVVLELRLPRALTAFATGALLALAGALMQVLLRNPLADPYVLGVSGGAAVAALIAMMLGASGVLLTGGAFLGALGSMLLVFALARAGGAWSATRLLLTGIVVAAGWGALISFLLAVAPEANLRGMLFWLMGDLSEAPAPATGLFAAAVGLLAALVLARPLNVLARGDLQAKALGVPVDTLNLGVYLLASLLTAVAVTMAGTIGFVGLVVPHMVRLLIGSDHRLLLPGSALLGGILLVLADTVARSVIAPQQLPVGVITAMIGVPLFLFLLARSARSVWQP